MNDSLFEQMAQSIIDGEDEEAAKLAQQAIDQDIDPLDAINKGFILGVNHVGDEFSSGNAFLPELVMAGEAMKSAIEVLEPELNRRGTKRQMLGKVVIATVEGDIHDIGKTLVATMMSAAGFDVIDMGVDVPIVDLAAKAKEVNADIVAVSALLTTTMLKQKDVLEALDDMGMRPGTKLMVGGAPVTRSWMEEIGADGYSEDAIGAVAVAKELVGAE